MNLAQRLRVYFVVDPEIVGDPLGVTEQAISGGVTAVQLRMKNATTREFLRVGESLRDRCNHHDVLFFVNDRLDVAMALGADGIHLGPHDLPVDVAARLAPHLIVGGSAGSVETARALERSGAHYLGCGAIYEARTVKPDASAPRGLDFVRAVAGAVSIPFVGIGGITAATAADVVRCGAAGVATVREIGASEDPAAAAEALAASVRAGLDSAGAIVYDRRP
ncbi:MAG: thiamine phosphate synthase [bacterium]